MNNKIPEFQPTEACKKCRGKCCKHMGCHFSPSDFEEVSFEYLKSKIEEGYISIDWWEELDGPNSYYLRMRHVGKPVVDPSWGGQCILLTKDGCPLPFDKRPLGARSLEPHWDDVPCAVHYSKEQCKNEWKKYAGVLVELVEYFSEKE